MSAQTPHRHRPAVVTAAAVLLFLVAAFSALSGFGLFALEAEGTPDEEARLAAASMVLFALALMYVVLGILVLRGSARGRMVVLVVMAAGVLLELFSFSAPESLVTLAVAIVVIGIVGWHPEARKYFAGEHL